MHQDLADSINGDTSGHFSGQAPQDTSTHPQMSAFAPDPALPPGLGDLAVLERLKYVIKNNQHEVFRAVPQPAVLASLWQGPATLGSDSDGPASQPLQQHLDDSSSDLTGKKNVSLDEPVDPPALLSKYNLANSRIGSRDNYVTSVNNISPGRGVESIRTDYVDPPNGHLSHADLTHPEAIQDVKPDMSVEPLTPLTPTSLPSIHDHPFDRDQPVESHDDVPASEHVNRSRDESVPEIQSEKTMDVLPSSPHGLLDARHCDSEDARGLDHMESRSDEQPREEIRNIYERPPELARRLDLESRIDPRPGNTRYEPRSESHLHSRVEHTRSGSGRDSDRLPHSTHSIVDRSPVPHTRLEDRISDGSRSGQHHNASATANDRSYTTERISNAPFKPPVNGGHSATERHPFSESRRFDGSRVPENGCPLGEARYNPDVDLRGPAERRPAFEERRGPYIVPLERRNLVDLRLTNGRYATVALENRFDDSERRQSAVERPPHDEHRPPPSPVDRRPPPVLEEGRSPVDIRRRAPSPAPVGAAPLSSPSGLAFPRTQSVIPTSVHRPYTARPVAQPERTDSTRTPSLQERISDAPPVSTRLEEPSRTLPPRMAASVHAAEARNRTMSNPDTRSAEDSRAQLPAEPARDMPPPDRLPPTPERLSYQVRTASSIDRDDRCPPPRNDSRERRPPPPPDRPRTMSYTRPVSPSRPPSAPMLRPRTPVSAPRPPLPPADYRRDSRVDFRPRTPEQRPRSPERRPTNYNRPPPPPDRRNDAPLPQPRGGAPPPAPYRRYEPPAQTRPLSPPPRDRYPTEPVRREPERVPIRAEFNGRPPYVARPLLETRPPPPQQPYVERGRAPPAPPRVAPDWERELYRATPAPAPIRDDRRMDVDHNRPRIVEHTVPPPPRDAFYPSGPTPAAYERPTSYLPPTPMSATYPPYNESRARARSRSPIDDRRPPLKRARDDVYDYEREARDRNYYAAQGPPPSASVFERDSRRTPPPTAVPYRR